MKVSGVQESMFSLEMMTPTLRWQLNHDCIHWVEREELAVLEYLNMPRPKQGYGVFGQGWERPQNVFMAAQTFQKQLKQQQTQSQTKNVRRDVEQETEAQAQARENASFKLKMEKFSGFWEFLKKISPN